MKNTETNSLMRRLEMYAMVNSIENDFIENYIQKLSINDIPIEVRNRAQNINSQCSIEELLRALDIQAYIEIANINVFKLGLSKSEKDFINRSLHKIISIRNRVMHPRLFEFYDYVDLNECFIKISDEIKTFEWKNVKDVIRIINDNPAELRKYEVALKKSENVIENLPTVVDFYDTSFIGRRKEIGEIKEKLFKNNVHILSILGDGGVGKTAITIKLLYDLLDDERNPFDLILWVSLKTRELNNYEFSEISNAITNTGEMYKRLGEFIGDAKGDIKKNLIKISKQFNTLLVLDNLETINTEDVRDFLDEFSEDGKVIITSRIGLGEMEHRYFLSGLSDIDLDNYVDVLLALYGKESCFTYKEKQHFSKEELHANPLAIKWFIRGLADGQSPQDLLNNKSNLINFCMSNVYDKLSDEAKDILLILKSINKEISFAELVYIIGVDDYNEVEIRGAINDLCKCNFIDTEKFKFNSVLSITDFANEFLRMAVVDSLERRGIANQKLKQLYAFDQKMMERRISSPYSLQTFYYDISERSKSVASFYLYEAVEFHYRKLNDTAVDYVKLAKSLCPKYFECNKVDAYISRVSNPQKALEEYEIAKKNVSTDKELRWVLIDYKELCLLLMRYEDAMHALEQAIAIEDEMILQFEKVKINVYMGRYDDANSILDIIESYCHNEKKLENMLLTWKAEIIRRKSEKIRDKDQRVDMLKNAVGIIMSAKEMDSVALKSLSKLLLELFHFYYDVDVLEYIYNILSSVDNSIFKMVGIKEMRKRMSAVKDSIPNFDNRRKLMVMLLDINAIIDTLNNKEGVVYALKNSYGFIRNKEFYQGIYFALSDIDFDIKIGDVVKLGDVFMTPQGFVVRNLELVRHSI